MKVVATTNASALNSNVDIRFEFETTEPMEISFSGWYFIDVESGWLMGAPLDDSGRLLPGRHVVAGPGYVLQQGTNGSFSGEISLILGPVPPDTDNDGLNDYDELNTYHSDPTKVDTDGDGLDDSAEVRIHHTLPNNLDTDGDGFTDGFEYISGKSPLDPLSTPAAALTIHPAIELRVLTKLGASYRIQYSADLQVWMDTDTLIEGNGGEIKQLFEAVEAGAKYWRVREVD